MTESVTDSVMESKVQAFTINGIDKVYDAVCWKFQAIIMNGNA